MKYAKRKPNRLPNFDYSQSGAYFLTICTQDRKNLLSHIVGGGVLDAPSNQLTAIGKVIEECILSVNNVPKIHVDKYVIMPNHIHLILLIDHHTNEPTSTPVNAAIPRLISGFKRLCHQRVGFSIFQRSYHDHVIRGEADYQMIWQYIDSNPALWTKDCFYETQADT